MTQLSFESNFNKPECDIVLKGGVTSGVVYPKALVEIAKQYRLSRIGGTSAGAIAAGAAAAAQLGEIKRASNPKNTGETPAGFQRLENLPSELAMDIGGQTLLERLFQPQQPLIPVFRVFTAGIRGKSILLEAINQFWLSSIPWALPGMIFLYWQLSKFSEPSYPPILCVLLISILPLLISVLASIRPELLLNFIQQQPSKSQNGTSQKPPKLKKRNHIRTNVQAFILASVAIFLLTKYISSLKIDLDLFPVVTLLILALIPILSSTVPRKFLKSNGQLFWQFIFELLIPISVSLVLYFMIVEPYKKNLNAYSAVNFIGTIFSIWGGFLFGLVVNIFVRFFREIYFNNYGFCNGNYSENYDQRTTLIPIFTKWTYENLKFRTANEIPLTVWLDYYFYKLAEGGNINYQTLPNDLRTANYRSVTFGQLEDEGIHLSLKTTNLTNQMSMKLPFSSDHVFYYKRDEFARLFPKSVMTILDTYNKNHENPNGLSDYRILPDKENLPIIIAVRMSLSFPILLSAIKLYTYDGSEYRPCWFSDGGITSNFPVSMFDEPLPKSPTFSIDLIPNQRAKTFWKDKSPKFLPDNNTEWTELLDWSFEQSSPNPGLLQWLGWQPGLNNFFGFLFSIFGSAQNWRDNSYIIMPGFRDRTARVQLDPSTGGLNLAMTEEQIHTLACAGQDAAQELVNRFNTKSHVMGWENHKWMRARSLLPSFFDFLKQTGGTYVKGDYEQLFQGKYSPSSNPLTSEQIEDAINIISLVSETISNHETNPFEHDAPKPESIFRMRPKE